MREARRPGSAVPVLRRRGAALLALLTLLGALAPAVLIVAAPAGAAPGRSAGPAATASAPLTGAISGPTNVAPDAHETYSVTATGGPAVAANGTIVGNLSFTSSIVGANTTGGAVDPPQGVFVNGSTNLSVVIPNATEPLTLYVDVTSSYHGTNSSTNLTYAISILQPIVLAATLKVVGPTAVKAFDLAVELDGAVVGTVAVPTLTGGQSYPLSFSYLAVNLAPGWHTFSISLAEEHGLVVFQNGAESYSISFYVPGPAPDYTLWIVAGIVAVAAVAFIWVTQFGARRRPKGKA